ncbi:Putative transcriptional regulator of 2-aminoethylphosphonate degradation operons [Grimontia celer]|uniref:Putative transcriptional regulator of 2-aminoethylphosphonate degradation operons n=1 Tax=Grimontia celer TaxID=1796497 RepID=A0A128F7Z7_9GAMM|nr:UTRA domain-containing protein [Grimontia celer]CZF82892.1 Putative transcriptional regulator of 2-aminoethylphosphonate degradation operons [Grimontia celer]
MQYIKITDAIREQIQSGQLAAGTKLPSERKLAEAFKTTRVTLREALSLLEADGLIFREDRRGWFISQRPLIVSLSKPYDFNDVAVSQGRKPSTEVLSSDSMMANKESSEALSLPPFSDVFRFERVHGVDGRPVMYAEHYLRAERVPNLLQHGLEGDLSELYHSQWQLRFTKSCYRLVSTTFDKDVALATRSTSGSPAMKITKVNFDESGVAQEVVFEYWRCSAIELEMEAAFNLR